MSNGGIYNGPGGENLYGDGRQVDRIAPASLIDKYTDPGATHFFERRKLICPSREAQAVADEVSRSGEWTMVKFPESFDIVNAVILIERPVGTAHEGVVVDDAMERLAVKVADAAIDRHDAVYGGYGRHDQIVSREHELNLATNAYRAAKGAR